MKAKVKAHTHVFASKVNVFGEKGHNCVKCGFRIPDSLLAAAVKQGAKVQAGEPTAP